MCSRLRRGCDGASRQNGYLLFAGGYPFWKPSAPTTVDDVLRRRSLSMWIELALFILSAFGLVATGKDLVRHGQQLGFWG